MSEVWLNGWTSLEDPIDELAAIPAGLGTVIVGGVAWWFVARPGPNVPSDAQPIPDVVGKVRVTNEEGIALPGRRVVEVVTPMIDTPSSVAPPMTDSKENHDDE